MGVPSGMLVAMRSIRAGLAVSLVFGLGCYSTVPYGSHRLKSEWSLVGICGPHGRTWLEDGAGQEILTSVTRSSASPDRQWLALFDYPTAGTLHLLDVRRDALRKIPIGPHPWDRSVRWAPDSSAVAFLAGDDPTRLAVVRMGGPFSLEWRGEHSASPLDLEIEWRDGAPSFRLRGP